MVPHCLLITSVDLGPAWQQTLIKVRTRLWNTQEVLYIYIRDYLETSQLAKLRPCEIIPCSQENQSQNTLEKYSVSAGSGIFHNERSSYNLLVSLSKYSETCLKDHSGKTTLPGNTIFPSMKIPFCYWNPLELSLSGRAIFPGKKPLSCDIMSGILIQVSLYIVFTVLLHYSG